MPGALRGQKKHGVPGIGVTDARELSCGAENQTGSYARTAGALNQRVMVSPTGFFFFEAGSYFVPWLGLHLLPKLRVTTPNMSMTLPHRIHRGLRSDHKADMI